VSLVDRDRPDSRFGSRHAPPRQLQPFKCYQREAILACCHLVAYPMGYGNIRFLLRLHKLCSLQDRSCKICPASIGFMEFCLVGGSHLLSHLRLARSFTQMVHFSEVRGNESRNVLQWTWYIRIEYHRMYSEIRIWNSVLLI